MKKKNKIGILFSFSFSINLQHNKEMWFNSFNEFGDILDVSILYIFPSFSFIIKLTTRIA
jgi:hypothetical protein